MERPADLFDREREWEQLARFVAGDDAVHFAILFGRRRQGKSWLLRRLADATDGVYSVALEHDRSQALRRFGGDVARSLDLPLGTFHPTDWESALGHTRRLMADRGRRLLVLDEYPYMLAHSPELSSVLQVLHDDLRNDGGPPLRVVLCGSAIGVMRPLLTGTAALRGRVSTLMPVHPFPHDVAAAYWGIEDPDVALHVHSVVGGTPGYRELVRAPRPEDLVDFPGWLGGSVLDPTSALYAEDDHLLRDDPTITDRGLYHAVLQAIAGGATSRGAIASAIERPVTALSHPLDVLTTAGLVEGRSDALRAKRTTYRIAEPILQFHQAITRPRQADLEEGRWEAVWTAAEATYRSQILGPHLEDVARAWLRRDGGSTLGTEVGDVGSTVVSLRGRDRLEIDLVGLAPGEPLSRRTSRVTVLGEVKAGDGARHTDDLARLDDARATMSDVGVRANDAHLLLVARGGFTDELRRAAAERADVHLVDLATLYGRG